MKNVVKLERYYYPWDLERAIDQWVEQHNDHRDHESLNNVTPSEFYFGRQQDILSRRGGIKRRTLAQRRFGNVKAADE